MIRFPGRIENLAATPSQIIVIGSKENICDELSYETSWLCHVLSLRSDHGARPQKIAKKEVQDRYSFVRSIVSDLTPQSDTGVNIETWIANDSSKPIRLSLCLLPLASSRHNCTAKPHAITKFVKKCRGKGDILVALVLSDEIDAFAAGCAVARAGSLYSRKNGNMLGIPNSFEVDNDQSVGHYDVLFSKYRECDLSWITETAVSIQLACRLVDAPPNELHTTAFVAEAETIASELGAEILVIAGKELETQGFGGLYGVGKAASHPPALVVLSHKGSQAEESEKCIVLVGKGIVYDTGGLSLKSKDGMPGMKRDMGGAAALLGAFRAAVKSGCKANLHLVLCLAENSVGPLATRPDDIHVMYSKKTVEINNTDAEGRLVLGDGVAYAVSHLNPKILIDMATLTGAQGIATGQYFAALYSNDENLESAAVRAGRYSGDLCHPVPYAPEFFRGEFQSAVADMKNSVKNRSNAQVSCAGQFIGNHLGNFESHGLWLHVDMASPSYCREDERATGFGVALIQGILREYRCFD